MNARLLIPFLALTGCQGQSLELLAESPLTVSLDADEVEGDVVVLIDGLIEEDLDYLGPDAFAQAGAQLRVEIVLSEVETGRVDVEPLDHRVGISQWVTSLSGRTSDWNNRETDRESVRWGDKFLLVRYLDEGECELGEPCEIRLPLRLERRRGSAPRVSAEVRFGLYGQEWLPNRAEPVILEVDWEPAG